MNTRLDGVSVAVGPLERYCRNNHLSFIAAILVSAMLLVAMWTHVSHGALFAWVGVLLLAQGGQLWYSMRHLRDGADRERQQVSWMPGLMVAAIATGLAWGGSFFMLGLSDEQPVTVLMIFIIAGITAYAGVAKSDVFPLAIAFEAAALLPMCFWLFIQDGPVAQYMGIIGLLYLLLLHFLLRRINSMVQRVHSLTNENSDLGAALARVQQLEREGTMLRNMIDMIADPAIIVHDPAQEGRIVYANEAACAHLGADRETLYTLRHNDFDVRIDEEQAKLIHARLASDGRFAFQSVHRCLDGEEVPVEVFINQFHHEGVELAVTFVRNIASRLAEEERMRNLELSAMREHEFRSLAENLPEPIIRYATDGTRRYVNPAFEYFFGISLDKAVGRRVTDYCTITDPEGYAAKVLEAAQGASLDFDVVTTAFAEPRTYRVHLVPEMDANHTVTGVLAICHDLTEIREAEARMSRFFANMPGFAFTLRLSVDGPKGFPFAGPGIEELYGLRPEEVRDDAVPLFERIHIDDRYLIEEALITAASMLRPFQVEFRVCKPGAAERWIECRTTPESLSNGDTLCHGVSIDITERKRMASELADSRRFIDKVLDSISDPIFVKDEDHNLVLMNEAFCTMIGQPREVLLGKSDHVFLPEEQVKVFREKEELALKHGVANVNEEVVTAADGTTHYLQTKKDPFTFDNGRRYLVASVRDITERKRMEEEVAKREREFHSLADNLPDNIVRFDAEGRYRYINPPHERTLGVTAEDVIGKPIPDTHAQFKADVAQVLASGQAIHDMRQQVWCEGREELHDVSLVPEFDTEGVVVSVLGIGRDMTERYRVHEMLADAQRIAALGSWDWDVVANRVAWSEMAYEIYTPDERPEDPGFEEFEAAVHPDDLAQVLAAVQAAFEHDTPFDLDHRVVSASRGVRIVHAQGRVFRDADGKPVRMVGTVQDITERKQMEDTLVAREQEFRSLAESSPDYIVRYDREGRHRYLNDLLIHQLGLSSLEEVLGKRPSEIWTDGRFDAIEQAAAQAIASGEMVPIEVSAFGEDGALAHNLIYVVPERDAEGNIIGSLAFGRDITSIKKLEAALVERETEFRSLAENSPDPIYRYDRNCRRIYANRAVERLTGIPVEMMLGKSPVEFVPTPSVDATRAQQVIQSVLDSGQAAELEVSFVDAHGQEVSVHNVFVPEFDAEGKVQSVLCIGRDISERKAAEQALAEREAFLVSLLDAIPIPVFYKDREGKYLGINRAFEHFFGTDRAELIGKSVFDTHPKELAETYHAKDVEVFERRVERQEYEFQIKHSNGTLRDVLFSKAVFADAHDQVKGLIGAVMDITERKRAEIELQERFDEIVELNDRLTENARLLEAQTVDMETAQEQLKETLEFTEGVINAIPDLLFEVNEDGRYLNVWAHKPELLAAPKQELLGRTVREVLPPEAADIAISALREAAEHGLSHGKVICLDLPHGSSWFELSVSRMSGSTPSGMHFLVTSRDITVRKQMEDELRRSEYEFRALVENLPDPFFRYDRDHRRTYVNTQVEKLTGKPAASLLGLTVKESKLASPYWNDVLDREVQRVLDTGEASRYAMDYQTPEGEVKYYDCWLGPVSDEQGETDSVMLILRDTTERKLFELKLTQREQEFRALAENAPDIIMRYDLECRRTYVNPAFVNQIGLPEERLLGGCPTEYLTTPQAFAYEDALRRVLQTGESCEHEYTWQTMNDREVISLFNIVPEWDAENRLVSVLAIGRDITERKRMDAVLAQREREFRTLVENSADTVARYDRELCRLYANPAFGELVEGGVDALLGKRPSEVPGGEGGLFNEKKLGEVFATGEPVEFELKWLNKEGKDVYSLINLTPEFDEEGHVTSVLAVGRDITELYAYRQKIHRMAFYDPLTSLPNRALFNDRLRQMITDASWHGQFAGVMMIDMDRFKTVNDTMGHAVGDELLCETGVRLSTCVRAYDTVARLGGDEFAVLLPDVRSGADLGTIADKMRSMFDTPFLLEGKEVFVSCSIGIALYPDDSIDAEDLVKYADSAMYYAKRSGRNNFRFYANKLTESANERLMLESELRRALERNELSLHFQPKVRLDDSVVIGSEALLRWQHPQHGFVPPDKFIPIAEDSGLIVELGEWVLHEACRLACEMNGVGKSLHKVAINLSARQFMSNDLVSTVRQVLEETGCYPEWIELEITESLLLDEYGDVLDTLKAFRALGITIAIDDFGTGYSALSYLARFPINTLKIDRSFISTVTTDKYCAELVKAILSIAQSLGQQVVAEGVETAEQALFLQTHGCPVAQGYWFSKPVTSEALLALPGSIE